MKTGFSAAFKRMAKILMIFALVTVLAGCGNSGDSAADSEAAAADASSGTEQDGASPDTEDTDEAEAEASEEDSAEEYAELVFGELDNLGNNPNNLVQCPGGIAFDEEYIYFADKSTGSSANNSISRVRYDGSGYEVLPIEDANIISSHDGSLLLNIKDGYLYYLADNNNTIKRYNIETGAAETVLQSDANPAEITNMLIVNDYLYIVVDSDRNTSASGSEKSARVDVCDLSTFNTLTVFEESGLSGLPVVTSDGENVYLAYTTAKNKLYRIDAGKVAAYFESRAVAEEYGESVLLEATGDNYLTRTLVLAQNGFMEITNNASSAYWQSDYTAISYSGTSLGLISSYEESEDYITYFNSGVGRRFVIGNTFLLISVGKDESGANSSSIHDIVMFSGMDLNTPEVVYTSVGYWDYTMFGIHNDVLYLIEFEDKTGPVNLVSIDARGQVSSVGIA